MKLDNFTYKLLLSNGDEILNPSIDGLSVEFTGNQGGIVEIEEGAVFHNTKIYIGSMGHIHIKKTHRRGIRNTVIYMACPYTFKSLYIDEGCSIESSQFALTDDNNIVVKIGKDCMLSSNIAFRPRDGHTIYDIDTGVVLNRSRPIILGDHVWVGSDVQFLKGAEIPNNSIIGTRSVVSRKHTEEHTVIAGIPASVVKRRVGWDRSYPPAFKFKQNL